MEDFVQYSEKMEGKHARCYEVLQQASTHSIDNGVWEIEDLDFWANRCLEEKGDTERAISGYLMLLEREPYRSDEEMTNAILDRLSRYDNLTETIQKYQKKKQEDWDNPPDLLHRTIKLLKGKENRIELTTKEDAFVDGKTEEVGKMKFNKTDRTTGRYE
ncbi:MAG: hypothetical protein H3C71_07955 [Flavobacteriales bacterium]|nr:hypothetical protein [Flavobacteriales bacterium]